MLKVFFAPLRFLVEFSFNHVLLFVPIGVLLILVTAVPYYWIIPHFSEISEFSNVWLLAIPFVALSFFHLFMILLLALCWMRMGGKRDGFFTKTHSKLVEYFGGK